METNEIIGNNLKILMREKDISLREFARIMDLSPASVSLWVSGKRTPRLARIDETCNLFRISPSDLITPITDYTEKTLDYEGNKLFKSLSHENKMKAIGYMEALKQEIPTK